MMILFLHQQITIIKNVVCEILEDMEPDLVSVFVDNLDSKLSDFNYENNILNIDSE